MPQRLTGTPWMPVNNVEIRRDVLLARGGWRNVVCEDLDFAVRNRGLRGVVYEPRMQATLSDRRFVKDGFLRTVLLWGRANLRVLLQRDVLASSEYAQIR